jgi:hypothetical protein
MFAAKLTPEQQFAATDFSNEDQIIALLPTYVQEQHALAKAGKKNVSKAVNLEDFTLKTPFGDQTLLQHTDLILEANKRQCLYGANGTGKTLLFHNMSQGLIKDFPKHIHVHHCRELESHELNDTVLDAVVNSHPLRGILLKIQAKLKELIAADPDAEVKAKLETNLNMVVMKLNSIRSHDAEDRASKMLRVLGFDDIGQKRLVSAFLVVYVCVSLYVWLSSLKLTCYYWMNLPITWIFLPFYG